MLGLVSWLGGIVLLATNRDIIRLFEGYGQFNPVRLFYFFEKKRYKSLEEVIEQLNEEYYACVRDGKEFPLEYRQKRNELILEAVERFPDEERWLLPTSFGNIVRAFEIYPRVMYGIDSIPGWDRLLAVVPEGYRDLVDNSKAYVDFWVNVDLLSLLSLVGYSILALYAGEARATWFPALMLVVAVFAYIRARNSAMEWGNMVKAAFDVFLPELGKKMGFTGQDSLDKERELWRKFSQAILYRIPELIPERTEKNEQEKAL